MLAEKLASNVKLRQQKKHAENVGQEDVNNFEHVQKC